MTLPGTHHETPVIHSYTFYNYFDLKIYRWQKFQFVNLTFGGVLGNGCKKPEAVQV